MLPQPMTVAIGLLLVIARHRIAYLEVRPSSRRRASPNHPSSSRSEQIKLCSPQRLSGSRSISRLSRNRRRSLACRHPKSPRSNRLILTSRRPSSSLLIISNRSVSPDILRFVLVEPARRAEEVQAILTLEEIGERRAVLDSAQNRVNALKRTAEAQFQAARSSLLIHMQIPSVKIDDLLAAANARRKLLGLSPLDH
jgi:hypothetical protein